MSTPEDKERPVIAEAEFETFLSFNIPANLHSKYAQHVMIQPGEYEVVLSFFEIIPPPLFGPPGQQERIRKEVQEKGIRAECVARITIPLARFASFVGAMQGVLEKLTMGDAEADETHEPQNTAGRNLEHDSASGHGAEDT